jgi:hypothetical protein
MPLGSERCQRGAGGGDERCLRVGARKLWSPAAVQRAFPVTRLWRRRALAILAPVVGLACVTWAQTFFSAAAIVAVPACSNSDAGGVTPITGVLVLGDTLTQGHGCGTGDDQVYEYATIISIPTNVPGLSASFAGKYVTGGTSTCFTNATFVDLCTYNEGESAFELSIYAFNQKEWNATLEPDGGSTVTDTINKANELNPPALSNSALNCGVAELASIPEAMLSPGAGWTTTCTAAEQLNAPVTASCAPLQPVKDASP